MTPSRPTFGGVSLKDGPGGAHCQEQIKNIYAGDGDRSLAGGALPLPPPRECPRNMNQDRGPHAPKPRPFVWARSVEKNCVQCGAPASVTCPLPSESPFHGLVSPDYAKPLSWPLCMGSFPRKKLTLEPPAAFCPLSTVIWSRYTGLNARKAVIRILGVIEELNDHLIRIERSFKLRYAEAFRLSRETGTECLRQPNSRAGKPRRNIWTPP
jgi:hypothetical protein